MSLINKFIAGTMSLGLFLCSATLSYADEARPINADEAKPTNAEQANKETSKPDAILFRVENIKPVANEDGLTTKCTFIVTVFNRMQKEVEEADLDFIWKDDVSAKYAVENGEVVNVGRERALTIIQKNIVLTNIFPHEQKSFEAEVETDKCFLLLDQLEYKVNACIAAGDNIPVKNNKRMGNGSCIGNFDYINSKNPEYYSEFKDVPDSILEQQAEEKKERELSGIEKAYKAAKDGLAQITEELNKIVQTEDEEEEAIEEAVEESSEEKAEDKAEAKDDSAEAPAEKPAEENNTEAEENKAE